MDHLYNEALETMAETFSALARKVGNPTLQPMGNGYVYRYKEKSIYQAIVLKLARVVTGLQAISLLNKTGLLQEQAALQRTLDEFEEDITFLCFGLIFDEITDLHKEYLAAFYEEEFDDPKSATRSTQKRPMIPRKKIRAFVSKDMGAGYDQSSTIDIGRTISKTLFWLCSRSITSFNGTLFWQSSEIPPVGWNRHTFLQRPLRGFAKLLLSIHTFVRLCSKGFR